MKSSDKLIQFDYRNLFKIEIIKLIILLLCKVEDITMVYIFNLIYYIVGTDLTDTETLNTILDTTVKNSDYIVELLKNIKKEINLVKLDDLIENRILL